MREIREIILKKKRRNEWVGELTETLDKYSKDEGLRNYVYGELYKNLHVFRYPGATTGCIIVDDNNIIEEIRVYGDTKDYFYIDGVKEELDQFIGYRLIYEE